MLHDGAEKTSHRQHQAGPRTSRPNVMTLTSTNSAETSNKWTFDGVAQLRLGPNACAAQDSVDHSQDFFVECTLGLVVIHAYSVKVTGAKAILRDCQDGSKAGMADSRTHQLIPGTQGGTAADYSVSLIRGGDSRWRVSGLEATGQSSSASSGSGT